MNTQKYEDVPAVLFAKDLQALGFSRPMVYSMFNRADFPVTTIGHRKCVMRENFVSWMNRQTAGGGGAVAG